MKKMNNITNSEYSDEWFTGEDTVRLCYQILRPEKGSTVMLPFDSEQSHFVKVGKELGLKVIYGIKDFLESKDYEFDYLVTNPPFSLKDKVIAKVYEYKKPSTLVFPLDTLGGVTRHALFKANGYPEIYMPTRRVNYFDTNWNRKPGSGFHTVIMTFNRGTGISWE
jgi:hypothetical protein